MKHQPMIPTMLRANDCFTIISKTAKKEKKNDKEKDKKEKIRDLFNVKI